MAMVSTGLSATSSHWLCCMVRQAPQFAPGLRQGHKDQAQPHLLALVGRREESRPAMAVRRRHREHGIQAAQQGAVDQHLADAGVAGHAREVLAQGGQRLRGRRLQRPNLLQRGQRCRGRGTGGGGE